MRPLQPEFIAPRRLPALLWWVPTLLAAAALTVWALAWRHHLEAQQLRQHMQATRTAAPVPVMPAATAPPPYADSARELLSEQSSDWAATLLALERTALQGVTPVAIELQARDRTARVEVEFTDYAILMRYLAQLNAGLEVAQWSLVSAQRTGSAGAPVGTPVAGVSTAVVMRRW
jgi:hypothetical protein